MVFVIYLIRYTVTIIYLIIYYCHYYISYYILLSLLYILLLRMGIRGVRELVEIGRLRWYGHVERMEEGNMVSECRWIKVEGKRG